MTAGALFEGTRIGLTSWFAAGWYVVHQPGGVSALGRQNVPPRRAKRPGGGKTRLDDDRVRRHYTQLAGRRGP